MRLLAIDTCTTEIRLGARNGAKKAKFLLEAEMRQSEKLLPAIDSVLKQLSLSPSELDCIGVCMGPGSFTGLRLGLSAAKALSFAAGIPLYGFSSLEIYAEPFIEKEKSIISVADAKKGRFYAMIFSEGGTSGQILDEEPLRLAAIMGSGKHLVSGPDAALFCARLPAEAAGNFFTRGADCDPEDSLMRLAERSLCEGREPLSETDGPIYVRKSEAEQLFAARNAGSC